MKNALKYILIMTIIDVIVAPIGAAILACVFSIWDKRPWMEQFWEHTVVIFIVFLILTIRDVIRGKY